jgi:DNA-binding phage protein
MQRITNKEYKEFLKFKTLKTDSPAVVVANILDRIRVELEGSEMDEIELAKRVGMQAVHLRKVLSKTNRSDPKLSTVVKISVGLNLIFQVEVQK